MTSKGINGFRFAVLCFTKFSVDSGCREVIQKIPRSKEPDSSHVAESACTHLENGKCFPLQLPFLSE